MICFEKLKIGDKEELKKVYALAYYPIAHWIKRNGGNEETAKSIFKDALLFFIQQLKTNTDIGQVDLTLYLFTASKIIWIHRSALTH